MSIMLTQQDWQNRVLLVYGAALPAKSTSMVKQHATLKRSCLRNDFHGIAFRTDNSIRFGNCKVDAAKNG